MSQIERIEASQAQSTTDLNTLTQSLPTKAFRGDLVPQDPNDEPASVLLERIQKVVKIKSAKPTVKN